jgi:hypothetical protein
VVYHLLGTQGYGLGALEKVCGVILCLAMGMVIYLVISM